MSTPEWGVYEHRSDALYARMLADAIRENVVRLREARGWSRPDLAGRVTPKTSYQQIERLEKGERKLTIEWIERLAGAFKIEPHELMGGQAEAAAPVNVTLEEPVAMSVARTFARVALGEAEPDESLVKDLSLMLQEIVATFAKHPTTRHDPLLVQPVVDLLERRFAPQ